MSEYKFSPKNNPDPVLGPDTYFFPILQYKQGKGYTIFPDAWKQKDFEQK